MLVRFYAVGREITGVQELACDAASMPALMAQLRSNYDARMERLLTIASLLHNGVRRRPTDDVPLAEDDVVDVLPPFAGG